MEKRDLQRLLNQPYNKENWKQIVQFVFPNVSVLANPTEFSVSNDKIKKFSQIGNVRLNDGKNLAIFELILADNVNIQRNRVELNNEISKYIDQEQIHGVLSVFEQGGEDYRFTFSAKSTEFDESESDFVQKRTDTKRYTYVLGKNESCKTPADRFYALSQTKDEITISSVQDAFSVEALSKEFFNRYKEHFEKFWKYVANNKNYSSFFNSDEIDKKEIKIRDFTKKLLGRIVFLHFLQKKGWLGCPMNQTWGAGDKKFMLRLFQGFEKKEKFHSLCLNELFFKNLNGRRDGSIFILNHCPKYFIDTKVPYLNGGLFEEKEDQTKYIDFPSEYFEELLEFFNQYNFTVDENNSNDHEVGIDPEMLGHIFENLLEDNRDKGAFYTPKAIVQYMCKASLKDYLCSVINIKNDSEVEKAISDLIDYKDAEKVSDLDLIEKIACALNDVKICDPAIGSGAFPMGILNVIIGVVEVLHFTQPDPVERVWNISNDCWDPYTVKKSIIQNSIYGVDIEEGAVDIARLRFWLALVVEDDEPSPLPNLDFKIMQGNSLFESFEGVDLSKIIDDEGGKGVFESDQIDIFTGSAQLKETLSINYKKLSSLMSKYFNIQDPDKKRELFKEIDDEILNHIATTIANYKKQLKEIANGLEERINVKVSVLSSPDQIENIRVNSKEGKKLIQIRQDIELFPEKEEKLKKLNVSKERPFFLWKLFFSEVFNRGGFDIVIGNPPYISYYGNTGAELTDSEKTYLVDNYSIVKKKNDRINSMNLFSEKSMNLLKEGGNISFIVNKTFGVLPSYKDTRKYFTENYRINYLITDLDPFKAIVDCLIFSFKKLYPSSSYSFKYYSGNLSHYNMQSSLDIANNLKYELSFSKYQSILRKFEQTDEILSSIITINRGVNIGGCFEEFLSSKRLNSNYQKYLSGTKCISPYSYEWTTDDGFLIFDLEKEKRLRENGKTLVLGNHERFLGNKVFIPESGQRIMAAYSEEIIYSAYGLLVGTAKSDNDLKYAYALLNSDLITFYCIEKEILRKGSKATPHVGVRGLNTVPIFLNPPEKELLIQEIDKILLNNDRTSISMSAKKINELVYSIYNLDRSEIDVINQYFDK